ncbi:citrate transporter [Intrasporangium oryzae NRRL B-24470]|uniref:Citrate transporter n=1 Tax=Intrasporangium oryzae NRRL B-24470 TaxID=1386089 RepID=W9GEX8_9MICO|nr:SLC13 family permease [Intrasporangium oryzae]EWT02429.1 citrate transporter [Intrasporangium oryzae NRRL B-24470]
MSPATTSLLILAATVALFVWNRLSVGVVAILTALALYATGLVSAEEALSGFGDPVVVFIASLFIVSEAIDATGVTTWAGQRLIDLVGEGTTRLFVAVLGLCALLTAVITLNGSVAALLPMVLVLAVRIGVSPSRMLMPMVFTGSAGSLLALTGSPINVIVSEAAQQAGGDGFGFFEFTVVGVPLVVGTILVALVVGPRVLPREVVGPPPRDLSRHAGRLAEYYELEGGFYRLRVRPTSPLVGVTVAEVEATGPLGHPDVGLIGVQRHTGAEGRAGGERLEPSQALQPDDVLVVTGASDAVSRLVVEGGLAVAMRPVTTASGALMTREVGVSEVVVPPRSPLVGEELFPGQMRGNEIVVLRIRRLGKDVGANPVEVAPGDSILVHGTWPAIDALVDDRDVLLVDSPDLVRRQAVPLGPRSGRAIAVLAAMVVALALGLVPPAIAGLAAATAMVLLRVITSSQAYRAVSWQTVVLIGGLIPLSTAIRTSGAADAVAGRLIDIVGSGRPYLLLVALFVLTGVIGQVISNTATVLIVTPIAVAAAQETHVSVQPVLMLIAVAGAAALLTPISTPANLMVMGPGGYRFGDYWKLGLPVMLLWLGVSLAVIPLVWRF